ncbi:unnamed protein product [Amoebophrya sp. A120]|nr:unnamed protein product [Amoebophrya sp. A120]|eukprot:GSA120T00019672001.1
MILELVVFRFPLLLLSIWTGRCLAAAAADSKKPDEHESTTAAGSTTSSNSWWPFERPQFVQKAMERYPHVAPMRNIIGSDPDPFQCPGTAWRARAFHAKCRLSITISPADFSEAKLGGCRAVAEEILSRVHPATDQDRAWKDPHNLGKYEFADDEAKTEFIGTFNDPADQKLQPLTAKPWVMRLKRTTNLHDKTGGRLADAKQYTDKINLVFVSHGVGTDYCTISGCSESQVFSILDQSTNYCNLRNLVCYACLQNGEKDKCPYVKHSFSNIDWGLDEEGKESCTQHDATMCISGKYLEELEGDHHHSNSKTADAARSLEEQVIGEGTHDDDEVDQHQVAAKQEDEKEARDEEPAGDDHDGNTQHQHAPAPTDDGDKGVDPDQEQEAQAESKSERKRRKKAEKKAAAGKSQHSKSRRSKHRKHKKENKQDDKQQGEPETTTSSSTLELLDDGSSHYIPDGAADEEVQPHENEQDPTPLSDEPPAAFKQVRSGEKDEEEDGGKDSDLEFLE